MALTIGLAIFVFILGGVALLVHAGRKDYQEEERALKTINEMSIDEARDKAISLLADPTIFRCVSATRSANAWIGQLPRELRSLFQRYEHIETVSEPKVKLYPPTGKAVQRPDLFSVGVGMEGTESEYEIGVSHSSETLYELYIGETPDPIFGTYRSVYHWVISTAREVEKLRNQ